MHFKAASLHNVYVWSMGKDKLAFSLNDAVLYINASYSCLFCVSWSHISFKGSVYWF